jgi:hypothetical protein
VERRLPALIAACIVWTQYQYACRIGCQAYEVDLKQKPTFLRNVGRRYSGKLVDVPE